MELAALLALMPTFSVKRVTLAYIFCKKTQELAVLLALMPTFFCKKAQELTELITIMPTFFCKKSQELRGSQPFMLVIKVIRLVA